jgi:arsenate reductase
MAEAGVNIYEHRSKSAEEYFGQKFDLVVTVCDNASRVCPTFPGAARTIRRGFDDPPSLALAVKSEADALDVYRRVRDEIRDFIEGELMGLLER